ncbi:MAG: hypothetical protein A2Y65_12965 [Deltaproteobacteria bacterium RBG_13_52_11]|nr:MAG: hypothetical protein A2Y65_12965 [Deltaproteobacteria bacterium RBG_13_52_11]
MKRLIYHILIPAIMPIVFFRVAMLPVEVLGCLMRGLLALLIAFVSGLAAIGAAVMGLRGRMRGDRYALWWLASSIILAIPVVAFILLA